MDLNSRIYLVGFMGSGKTTAGKKLSSLLGWEFVDLDGAIEAKTGKKIPEIFATRGEAFFRKTETGILRNLDQNNIVVSTGGGAPCHDSNMDYMLSTGLTVYLKLTPAQLMNRLEFSKTERPLISGIDKDDLQGYIEQTLQGREKYYNRALVIIEDSEPDINLLLQKIRFARQ